MLDAERFFACHCCINRRVRVHMRGGLFYDGVVTNVDQQNLFLRVDSPRGPNIATISRFGGFFGSNAILTLALFDLLAIALFI